MKTIEQSRLEFLEDVAAHYNSNNRAILNGDCVYQKTAKSEGCVIGRACPIEIQRILPSSKNVKQDSVWQKLPEELRELGKDFLHQCQCLHDNSCYWNEEGLSDEGKQEVERIKREYSTQL